MRIHPIQAALVATALGATAANASDLRVAPSTVEAPTGSQTATLSLLNGEQKPISVQIRVMRWTQQNGQDSLVPTINVVASPPFVTLQPSQRYLVRLVRTAQAGATGEESYRVLVDELPGQRTLASGTIDLVLRHSIPVFFSDTPDKIAKVTWTIVHDAQGAWLEGLNSGERRLRLSDVSLDQNGNKIFEKPGLVGYVLPGGEMRWPLSTKVSAGSVHMSATADTGPIDVAVPAAASR
jgi:fimbrial chaperone protein